MLSVEAIDLYYGASHTLRRVSLTGKKGEVTCILGRNGVGKTSLLRAIFGMQPIRSGRIRWEDRILNELPPHQRARRGLVRTFQITQLFDTLTPLETITLVIAERERTGARLWRPLVSERTHVDEAAGLLAMLHLGDVLRERAATLPYGRRRLLEIAIALAARPRVLLLDEPLAGVPTSESREILDTLSALPAAVTVLLIEHDMDVVFRFATRISVLVNGALLVEGPADEIARNPQVRAVYLGESRHG